MANSKENGVNGKSSPSASSVSSLSTASSSQSPEKKVMKDDLARLSARREEKAFWRGMLYGFAGAILVIIFSGAVGVFVVNGFTFEHSREVATLKRWLGVQTLEPGAKWAPQDETPIEDVAFTVHFNGDGLGEGLATRTTSDWKGLDDLIETLCKRIIVEENPFGPDFDFNRCKPSNGAKLFTHDGVRCMSLNDIPEGMRTYVIPQGVHFVWPLGKVGDVIIPKCVESPIPERPIQLRQLSMSPRVFTIENFMTEEEVQKIIEHNAPVVKPSEVGFAGWRDSTRTSSTAWDFTSWAAKRIQQRAFDIVTIPYNNNMADAVQVLRYNNPNASETGKGEWYKPHTDWFDKSSYDRHDPTVSNGTNRFVTVFLYLNDVEEGGETVFPLSTTHEGYNGETLTHPGTDRTAGYISNEDAEWVCNSSSKALRSIPRSGNAVMFYSQGPTGALDKLSLHGGCPVLKGQKWSANVWIWNREKPSKTEAKDGKPKDDEDGLTVRFRNSQDKVIAIYWDDGTEEMVFQMELGPEQLSPMKTYDGHRFVARIKETDEQVAEWRASDDQKGDIIDF